MRNVFVGKIMESLAKVFFANAKVEAEINKLPSTMGDDGKHHPYESEEGGIKIVTELHKNVDKDLALELCAKEIPEKKFAKIMAKATGPEKPVRKEIIQPTKQFEVEMSERMKPLFDGRLEKVLETYERYGYLLDVTEDVTDKIKKMVNKSIKQSL